MNKPESGSEEYNAAMAQRTQAFFKLLKVLDEKITSLGSKRKSFLLLSNDLAEIYESTEDIQKLITDIIRTPSSDFATIADDCVDLRVRLEHMRWHIRSSRARLDSLADYCYERAKPESELDDV